MVKTLAEPIHNTSRKFTCDRYFTAVELFEHLLNVKLTSVGTVMPNRKHFPIALTTREIVKLILLYLLLKIL